MVMWYIFFMMLSCCVELDCVLDGRIAPIYLSTRYTFSKYEWARGTVFFMDGFDVPQNGTIFLGINSGKVYGKSNINSGTLILETDLAFHQDAYMSGSCFLSLKGHILNYGREWPGVLGDCPYLKFLSGGTMIADRKRSILHTETTVIDLRGLTGSNIVFSGGIIAFRNNRFLTATGTGTITFDDITIIYEAINSILVFNNKNTVINSNVKIYSSGTLSLRNLSINGFDNIVSPKSKIRIENIDLPYNASINFDNASLDCVSTSTASITIGNINSYQGSIIFSGHCSLGSSTGNKLLLNPDLDLIFTAGSQLSLASGTHLVYQ